MASITLVIVGITLLALASGMFLLAKTSKDNLGLIYKIAAWFIIISSIINLGCAGLNSMMKLYSKQSHDEMMMYHHKMDKKMYKHFMKGDKMDHHNMPGSYGGKCGKEGCMMQMHHRDCAEMEEKYNCRKNCCMQPVDTSMMKMMHKKSHK